MMVPLSHLRPEPGWFGFFTRAEAWGAIPNSTRIVKCRTERGDSVLDGSLGIVLGSLRGPQLATPMGIVELCYFVEWDALPRCAVAVIELKIARVQR
jgi:hypothetical protein